ncbi:MAG: arginine--tRNA ligase, partial [Nanoarchaeota archaeon]
MNKIKEELLSALSRSLGIDNIDLEVPSNHELGDYSLHCYKIAKMLGKEPMEIANTVIKLSESLSIIKEVRHIGHYINFFVEKNLLVRLTLEQIRRENNIYGSSNIGMNKSVSIEHTSINPNASPHVGRARNAIIGDSIVRILRFQGYNVETHYFVNDVGKQIAMLVFGCNGKEVNFNELLNIYVEINKKTEENMELEKEVLNIIRKLESGDKVIKSEFKQVVKICVDGQRKILSDFGIRYDYFDYESKYLWSKEINSILDKLNGTGKLFVDNEGRYVLNEEGYSLAMKNPILVLTRGDKTSLYPLRDIAYTIEKSLKGFDRNIVVLGEDQKLYYQQIKIALSFLGYTTPEVVHYSFVLLQDRSENSPTKMSTRSGNIVLLEELM